MGPLYISPASGAWLTARSTTTSDQELDSGPQRYVLLRGDILHVGLAVPTDPNTEVRGAVSPANATADQIDPTVLGPITAHKLGTYLVPDTPSANQIRDKFADLADYVSQVPGLDTNCDATAPDTSAAPDTSESPTSVTATDRHYSGEFVDFGSTHFPVVYASNHIEVVVHPDGSVDGSYEVSYTEDLHNLVEYTWPSKKTYTVSGTLRMEAGSSSLGDGQTVHISEPAPTLDGCQGDHGIYGHSRLRCYQRSQRHPSTRRR
ncbi:MAG: hypothetical protein ABJD24_09825 [Acidimicrobiales bacterium]